MSNDVENWKKRTKRKGPFYLYEYENIEYSHGKAVGGEYKVSHHNPGKAYTLIWKEKDKTKIGILKDGMYCRYGMSTFGVLIGDSPLGLWQSGGGGTVDDDQFAAMQRVARGESQLPIFDIDQLQDLVH